MVDYVDLEGREYLHYQEWFKTEREDKRMKRYLLFMGCNYYPEGGIKDLIGSFHTPQLALTHCKKVFDNEAVPSDWVQIVDTENGAVSYFRTFELPIENVPAGAWLKIDEILEE